MYCYLLATSFGVSPASFVMLQSAPISINHCKQWICPCAAAEGRKVHTGQLHTSEVFQTYNVPTVSLFDMPEAGCTKTPQGRCYFKRRLCIKILKSDEDTQFWGRSCNDMVL